MKQAFITAGVRAIRTFAQTMAGGLGGLVLLSFAQPELKSFGVAVALVAVSAGLSAVVTFFQNFAEGLDSA